MRLSNLPWPPSVNHYWQRNRNGSMRIGAAGVAYRKSMLLHIATLHAKRIGPRVKVSIYAKPPDRRKRDLDNILKAILDALTHSGLIEDDSCIDYLCIWRGPVVKDGEITITVEEMICV